MYLKDNVPKEIPIHFHNEPNYDYHFIIKEFVGELEEKITLLGKNTEKYVTFSIPIEKKVARIDKKWYEITKVIPDRFLQFITSGRFTTGSLLNLVNNLANNTDTMIKNVKLAELNAKIVYAFFNTKT